MDGQYGCLFETCGHEIKITVQMCIFFSSNVHLYKYRPRGSEYMDLTKVSTFPGKYDQRKRGIKGAKSPCKGVIIITKLEI